MAKSGNPASPAPRARAAHSLTPKQQAAIAALLSERDTKAAAKAVRVGYRTLCRWLDLPDFQAELKAAERQAIDAAIRRLAELAGEAVSALREILTDADASPGARVSAANVSLSKLLDLRELVDLEARLVAVEAALQKGESKR